MRSMKRMLCLALTAGTLMTAMPVQVLAASDYKYITSVSLKVSIDLDSGDAVSYTHLHGADPSLRSTPLVW